MSRTAAHFGARFVLRRAIPLMIKLKNPESCNTKKGRYQIESALYAFEIMFGSIPFSTLTETMRRNPAVIANVATPRIPSTVTKIPVFKKRFDTNCPKKINVATKNGELSVMMKPS